VWNLVERTSVLHRAHLYLPIIFFVLLINGCSSEEELSDPVPHRMEAQGESEYIVEAQSSIKKQFRVMVIARDGRPVPQVTIFLSVRNGSAQLSNSTVMTDGQGIATFEVTTGSKVQRIEIEAFVPAIENPSLLFIMDIVAQMPAAIQLISGDMQEAESMTALSDYLQVKVVDAFGNAVKNITVNFSITSGEGSIDAGLSRFQTNSDGIAYASFTTGTFPVSKVTVSVGGSFPVAFTVFSLLPVTLNPVVAAQYAANLSWSKTVNASFSHYSILRSPGNTVNFTEVGIISDPDVTAFADEDTDIGRTYTYMVRVISAKGNQVVSNQQAGERGISLNLGNESDIADVVINKDKSAIYVARLLNKRVLMISTDTFQKTDSIELQDSPYSLAVSADQTKLYVALYGLPRFQVIDLASKKVLKEVDLSVVIGSTAIADLYATANGQLYASSFDGYVARIDESANFVANRVASNRFFSSGAPTFAAEHGNYLYMEESLLTPNSLFKIDMSVANAPIVMEDVHGTVNGTRGSALSSDGALLYLTSGQLVSTTTLKPIDQWYSSTLYSVQVSNQKLFGCFYGGSFERWKLDRLDLVTQSVERSIPLGFNSPRIFLSADAQSVFLVSLPFSPYYTVRIFKVNL